MKKFLIFLVYAFSVMLLNTITLSVAATKTLTASDTSPVTFLQNKGQWSPDILYQGTSTAINIYFLQVGLSFAQLGEEYPYLIWNLDFANTCSDNENYPLNHIRF